MIPFALQSTPFAGQSAHFFGATGFFAELVVETGTLVLNRLDVQVLVLVAGPFMDLSSFSLMFSNLSAPKQSTCPRSQFSLRSCSLRCDCDPPKVAPVWRDSDANSPISPPYNKPKGESVAEWDYRQGVTHIPKIYKSLTHFAHTQNPSLYIDF